MPLTDDLTFMLGNTGVVLNSEAARPFVDVLRVSGLDSAPFRETRRDHEGNDGGFMDAEFEKARDILIDGEVYAETDTMEEYLDLLKANYAPSPVLIPFYFKSPGVSERVCFVKPLGCRYDWDALRRLGKANIQFKMFAEDPRLYAASETSVDISFEEGATTGFGFDLGFDFGFGAPTSGTGGQFVTNDGNRPTPPIFTITGPASNPSINDETYGHTLAFNIELESGQTLEINTYYKTVRLNGMANRRSTMIGADWFFLEPGQTFISYNAVTGTGSSLNVTFRSAWR